MLGYHTSYRYRIFFSTFTNVLTPRAYYCLLSRPGFTGILKEKKSGPLNMEINIFSTCTRPATWDGNGGRGIWDADTLTGPDAFHRGSPPSPPPPKHRHTQRRAFTRLHIISDKYEKDNFHPSALACACCNHPRQQHLAKLPRALLRLWGVEITNESLCNQTTCRLTTNTNF